MKTNAQETDCPTSHALRAEGEAGGATPPDHKPKHIAKEEVILDAMGAFDALARHAIMENRSDLTKTQVDLIIRLSLCGKASMTTLAQDLAVSKEHVTRAMASLTKQGLVEKNRSCDNFRVIEASLTEKGEELARSIRMNSIRKLKEHLSAFSDEDLESFLRAAETATNVIQKYNL